MRWFHKVKPEWLDARRKYLSASDVKKLIPVTATGRPRTNMADAFLKAWADKQSEISEDSVNSSGVMARGHWLETYGIEEFNKLGLLPKLYHWDDALIYSPDGVACSPDALSVEMPGDVECPANTIPAVQLGEVKAYAAAAHYQAGFSAKMALEERWQIATAFYAIPTLEQAALIFFNPSTQHPLLYHLYVRADLADEIEMIGDVKKEYDKVVADFEATADLLCPPSVKASCITESEIEDDVLYQYEEDWRIMNPEGE